MRGIITVTGKDKVGIIGKVCTSISEDSINILDISQTILQGFFNMILIVDISESKKDIQSLALKYEKLGEEIGVVIRIQHEDVFNTMHKI